MNRHSDWARDQDHPEPAPAATGEPVAIAEAARLVIMAAVGGGWLTLDDHTLNLAITAVGVVGSVVATILARARTSPMKGGIWGVVENVVDEVIADRVREEMRRHARARPRPVPPQDPRPDPRQPWQ